MDSSPITCNGSEFSIRAAVPGDEHTIHALVADLAATLGVAHKHRCTVEDIRRFGLEETRFFEALIAESKGAPVGIVLYFYTYSTWRGRPGLYVQDLHVVEHCRGGGLGWALLSQAARRGREQGCTHLRLSVDLDNVEGRKFYARIGFVACDGEVTQQISDDEFDALANGERG